MNAPSEDMAPSQRMLNPAFSRGMLENIERARRGDRDSAEYGCQQLARDLQLRPFPGREARRSVLERVKYVYGLSFDCGLLPEAFRVPDIEQYRKTALPGVTIVTCAMNRSENLLRAIQTWLVHDEVQEIIVVDWSSDIPVSEFLVDNEIWDSRVKVVRVEGQDRWILSYAFNLGFRFVSCEKVLKADADIMLGDDFFRRNILDERQFIAGDWRAAQEGQEYINGFFYTWRSALNGINGFNEYITTYGWDDTDLYKRLTGSGLTRNCVDTATIWHQPHSDEERLGCYRDEDQSALQALRLEPLYSIRINRYIADAMPSWGGGCQWVPFVPTHAADNRATVEQDGDPPHRVPPETYRDAEMYALRELTAWRCGKVAWSVQDGELKNALSSIRGDELGPERFSEMIQSGRADSRYVVEGVATPRRLFVDVQHGLGNRLRALASGAAVAEKNGFELVVIWVPDNHCRCEIHDLFDYSGEVIQDRGPVNTIDASVWNYMEGEPLCVKDEKIDVSGHRDIYVKSAYALNAYGAEWKAENRFLRGLSVNSEIMELVEKVGPNCSLGAHIRMEAGTGLDHNSYDSASNWSMESHRTLQYWRDQSHYERFIERIDELLPSSPDGQLFVAADRPETYTVMQRRYGDKLRFLERAHYDRSREQIKHALADAILLSRCRTILGSSWSSFTELAVRLAEEKPRVEMSGKDF